MKLSYLTVGIIIVLLLGTAMRFSGINQFLESDEFVWGRASQDRYFMEEKIPNSLLSLWVLIPFIYAFGAKTWALRVPFIMFGLATIGLAFIFAKRYYGEKAAFWTTLLLSFSALHILASLQVIYEGSLLTFFTLLSSYLYLRYEETSQKRYLAGTGISFGLALLSKIPAVLFLPILFFYALISKKRIWLAIKDSFVAAFLGGLLFLFHPIISFISSSPSFIISIYYPYLYPTAFTAKSFSIPLLLIQLGYALLWIGPLFVCLLMFSTFKPKKQDIFLFSWIGVILLFYIFIIKDNFRPMERYMMILLPPLALLGGKVLSELRLNSKKLIFAAITLIASIFGIYLLNSAPSRFLPFYPKTAFLSELLNLRWDFLMPFTGSSGPVGFYIRFAALAIPFLVSGIIMAVAVVLYLKKKYKAFTFCVLIILSIGLAYNLLLAEEYLFSFSSPNINRVSHEMTSYINTIQPDSRILIFRNFAMPFYLQHDYSAKPRQNFRFDYLNQSSYNLNDFRIRWLNYTEDYYTFDRIGFLNFDSVPDVSNTTIIFIDFPYVDKTSELWQGIVTKCNKIKGFESQEIEVGYLFYCPLNPDDQVVKS